jgi:DNA polymerase sigma
MIRSCHVAFIPKFDFFLVQFRYEVFKILTSAISYCKSRIFSFKESLSFA